MCNACKGKNNFSEVGVKDMFCDGVSRVYLSGGNSKPPENEQFKFCPLCGEKLAAVKEIVR